MSRFATIALAGTYVQGMQRRKEFKLLSKHLKRLV